MVDVETIISDKRWCERIVPDALAESVVKMTTQELDLGNNIMEVSLLFCDDTTIRRLNSQWRGIDKATNVLSFATADHTETDELILLGDVILAYETCHKEAQEMRIEFGDHVAHLILHGFLHLLGFEHDEEDTAAAMESLEIRILNSMGLHNPYA